MITLVRPCRGHKTQNYYNTQSHDGMPHTGNDYAYYSAGQVMDEVFAAADGVVEWVGNARDLGWPNAYYINPDFDRSDNVDTSAGGFLAIAHVQNGIRFVTTYSHLAGWSVKRGDPVRAGQRVATIGDTGFSAGKHLHFELLFRPFTFGTATYGRSNPNPYFVDGIAAAGTITSSTDPEEFDLSDAQYKTIIEKLDAAIEHSFRAAQVANATEDRGDSAKIALLLQIIVRMDDSFRFIKLNDPDAQTLYEVEDGVARGITNAEWQAKGGLAPRLVEQWIIDGLLPMPVAVEGE